MKNGHVAVTIGEDNIKAQMKNWETTVGDTPYEEHRVKFDKIQK